MYRKKASEGGDEEGVFIWRPTAWPCAGRGCNVDGGWDVFVFLRIA